MASNQNYFTSKFIKDIGLPQYELRLLEKGYENFIDLLLMDSKDLDLLDICDQNHREKILQAVDDLSVHLLLEEYNLEYHYRTFQLHNIKSIGNLRNTKVDDTLLEKLEIKAPGHRKRLSICVQLLQRNSTKEPEQVQESAQSTGEIWPPLHPDAVALGYWNRPAVLPKLSHDFLCVKGYIKAGPESTQSDFLEFLVDSASDVVTARQELITGLGLEFLETIESHGVHSVANKPLYKGYLKLGKSDWMMVEVQPEEYESVGSTVMKKFFHFINGNFHQWIPNVEK